jgi:autotransporter passenger strand-loop-strand repeat protein
MSDTTPTLTAFTAGDLVISVYGDGDDTGTYTLDQAAPIVLEELTTSGTVVGQMVLPQTTTVVNGVTENAISGEYGSASEGSLELSGDGQSLVIMGYGVNYQTFNTDGNSVYDTTALGQTTSVPGGEYTAVPRVVADISYNGTVDTSTALYNVYNSNNPRSVATVNGTTFYLAGQGQSGDTTQGVFVAQDGASSATAIDTSTDTRTAEIVNGELYVSRDSTQGVGGTISNYGTTLPTTATTPTVLGGIDGSITLTAGEANGINTAKIGQSINLSPENFFFATPDILYVADSGVPKEGGIGDGGLQKWVYNTTTSTWTLAYTLTAGLDLVANTAASGTTGLIELTGTVVGGVVELYATNYTVTETGQSYLFGITDTLSATTLPTAESFTTLETAAPDTIIRGVAFAPTAAAATTSNTTVSSGSTQSAVQVSSGSFLDIQSGGTAIGATIFSGGSATVELGGVDSGSYIAQGGKETVLGSATGDSVDGIQLVSAATAVVSNEIILNGGTVELFQAGAIASGLTVASGGFLAISGNATAENTVISGGSLELESADAVVSGTLTFEGPGTIAVTANIGSGYGDQAVISGFHTGDLIDLTAATAIGTAGSAATLNTTTSGGNTVATISGGGSSETFLFAGIAIAGDLVLGSDGNGGEALTALPMSATVASGTTSSGFVVSSGFFLDVQSGGTIAGATILSGGSATVELGAIDSGSTISSGGFETVSGSANQDRIYGTQMVSAATAIVSNETIYSGGTVDLFLAGALANNMTVLTGGTIAINGHAIADDTVISGGVVELESPKATVSGSLTFEGAGTLAFTVATDAGYGDLAVISGFGAGDAIDEAVIGSGATFSAAVSGVETIATITSGTVTETLIFAGPAPSNLSLISDGNGGEEIVYATVTPTVTSVTSGSTQSNVIVTSGSTLHVLSGGTIVSASVLSGGSATVSSGGTDSGGVIAYGGNELVLGSATGDLVGGVQLVSAATAVVSNETVLSGGSVELYLAGVTANNLTVDSGGALVISGHAIANNTVINGGLIELESPKAVLSGSLTFEGAGTIEVTSNATAGYGDLAVISGFGGGDVIDFSAATSVGAAGSAATLSTTSSGGNTVVTVSGGGSSETFIFAGTAVAGELVLHSDGHGGEEITLSSPPPTSTAVSSGVTSTGGVVTSGSFEDILSGGTLASATILSAGSVTVEVGGTDSGSVISAGGSELVLGTADLDQVYGTQVVSAATAIVNNETVFNGGIVELNLAGVTASGLTVASGGTLAISGHVVADNTVISGGVVEMQSPKATLAGSLTFSGAGTLEFTGLTSAGYGDFAVISGFGAGDVIDETVIGTGATLSTTISGGNTVATVTSGSVTETLIFAGSVTSNLSLVSDGHGGEEVVFPTSSSTTSTTTISVTSGTTRSNVVVSSGTVLDVLSGGAIVSATILSGGSATVESGGTDSGSVISAGGSETVLGSATLDQVGGTQLIAGSVVSETILSGGSATVQTGATDSGSTVLAGGNEFVYGSANLDQIYGTQTVSSGATGSAGVVSNETVFDGGTIDLNVAGVTASNLTVDSGGTLILNGHVIASNTVISGGLVELESAKATLSGTLTFSGAGTIEVTGNTSAGYGDLAVISGFAVGDVIDLSAATTIGAAGSAATSSMVTSSGDTYVTVTGGGASDTFIFAGTLSPGSLTFGSDGNGGVGLTEVACFLPGTHILTDRGEVEVERLQVGDTVVTASGRERRLCWIGQGRALATRGRRGAATPLIVRKGALADNVPHRDLYITKGHSLYLDDVLIPVEFLVNHRTILWDDHAQEVTVYHLELDAHDVLVANGAPAESYRDDGNRWLFQNANTGWNQPPKPACAPVLTGGPIVDAVWARLLDRSGPRRPVPLTDEPDLHLLVDGRRLDATHRQGNVYVFGLTNRPADVRIVSRSTVPQELGLARDPRSLGVALRQIVARQGTGFRIANAKDARLVSGFHPLEGDGDFVWTDGEAAVPMDLLTAFAGPFEVVLKIAGTTRYIDDGEASRVA